MHNGDLHEQDELKLLYIIRVWAFPQTAHQSSVCYNISSIEVKELRKRRLECRVLVVGELIQGQFSDESRASSETEEHQVVSVLIIGDSPQPEDL